MLREWAEWCLGISSRKLLTMKIVKWFPFTERIFKFIHRDGYLSMVVKVRCNPYHPDRLCGLSPVINGIYKSQLVIAIIVGLISTEIIATFSPEALLLASSSSSPKFIGVLLMLLLLGLFVAGAFGLFTYSFHLLLTDVKEKELARLGELYQKIADKYSKALLESSDSTQSLEEIEKLGAEIERIRTLIEDVEKIPKWPVSLKISAVSSVTPPVVFSVFSFIKTTIVESVLKFIFLLL